MEAGQQRAAMDKKGRTGGGGCERRWRKHGGGICELVERVAVTVEELGAARSWCRDWLALERSLERGGGVEDRGGARIEVSWQRSVVAQDGVMRWWCEGGGRRGAAVA